jgi:predicted nucleic acid-binding protein
VLRASEIQERNRLSFWDALIVAAASNAGAVTLYTEDLNHGQVMEGIRIENPFLA